MAAIWHFLMRHTHSHKCGQIFRKLKYVVAEDHFVFANENTLTYYLWITISLNWKQFFILWNSSEIKTSERGKVFVFANQSEDLDNCRLQFDIWIQNKNHSVTHILELVNPTTECKNSFLINNARSDGAVHHKTMSFRPTLLYDGRHGGGSCTRDYLCVMT